MLFVPGNSYGLIQTSSVAATRASATQGALVTPVTNAYGTPQQLFGPLSSPAYGMTINANSNTGAGVSRNTVLQILIDPAGGTSYTELMGGIVCSNAPNYTIGSGGVWYYFPIYIPAGASVAVAARGSATAALRVYVTIHQNPRQSSDRSLGSFVETLGLTLGNSVASGISVTAGTTALGNWTLIGTTTKPCWYWEYGLQISTADTAYGAQTIHVDIGVGDGTVAGTDVIVRNGHVATDGNENLGKQLRINREYYVPAGSDIYARLQTSNATDPYQIVVYGCGG
jgi:hypothetical protein